MADYYPHDDSSDQSTSDSGSMDGQDDTEERAEGETALVPKSLFAGKAPEVGDTVSLKVVHIYEDEIEVEPETEEKEESGSAMDEAMNGMGEMAKGE